jgi:N-acetylglucosaminyldiphosphoundecaprenol N-acetyl-beta-D-mannosaminyltransferase
VIASGGICTFLNPYSYTVMRKHLNLLDRFSCIYIDGGLLARFLSLFGIASVQRCSFDMTSLAPKVFDYVSRHGKKIYFIGSKKEEITGFVDVVRTAYPSMNIVGFHDGYFEDAGEVIRGIISAAPDVVVVGMGTPRQEEFLTTLADAGWTGAGFTCGGFMHQTAKRGARYYPAIINRMGLRWLFRIVDEPKLLWRYLFFYIKFVVSFVADVLHSVLRQRPGGTSDQ